jgi:hypothetical protein
LAESGPDGDVADFAFRKLPRVFHEKKYLEILRAMDATPIDGSFAASLCVGYSRMSKEAEFREWYRTHGRSLLRCIGEIWDKDDIVRLTGVPAEHFEAEHVRAPLVDSAAARQPVGPSREMPLFRRGLRDRFGETETAAKMPRAVKRAITVGQRAKMVDRRAETGERRVILVNRIADLHRVVVYRLRAAPCHRPR